MPSSSIRPFQSLRTTPARPSPSHLPLHPQVYFAYELQRRLGPLGVTSCAVDPGGVRTSIWDTHSLFRRQPFKAVVEATCVRCVCCWGRRRGRCPYLPRGEYEGGVRGVREKGP